MQMNDELLSLVSTAKACDQVEHSGKMHLFKALPTIFTASLGTIIALTQPGKLSAKAAAGLGFLALATTASKVSDVALKKYDSFQKSHAQKEQNEEQANPSYLKRFGISLLSTAAVFGLAVAGKKVLPKILSKHAKPAYELLKQGSEKLANEINGTKLGTFVENKLNPFVARHPKALGAFSALAPIASLTATVGAGTGLLVGMVKDIDKIAAENYAKGKAVQQIAREEFDKIDAIEV